MWMIGRKIFSGILFSLVAFAGVASAQDYPTTPQPTQPPSQSPQPPSQSPQPTQPPSQSVTRGPVYAVNIATATVQGKRDKILTNARGMTLYYLTSDTPTKAACTGGCAKTWPPMLSKSTPTHAAALPRKLSVVNDANGHQVRYNGHLLYTYSGDSAPGQTAGNGLFGKWFVAKPDLAASVSGK
jgi:predicted lipoprotein with Yx(FWY)xxD motif